MKKLYSLLVLLSTCFAVDFLFSDNFGTILTYRYWGETVSVYPDIMRLYVYVPTEPRKCKRPKTYIFESKLVFKTPIKVKVVGCKNVYTSIDLELGIVQTFKTLFSRPLKVYTEKPSLKKASYTARYLSFPYYWQEQTYVIETKNKTLKALTPYFWK